jgi:hypothetical protein
VDQLSYFCPFACTLTLYDNLRRVLFGYFRTILSATIKLTGRAPFRAVVLRKTRGHDKT